MQDKCPNHYALSLAPISDFYQLVLEELLLQGRGPWLLGEHVCFSRCAAFSRPPVRLSDCSTEVAETPRVNILLAYFPGV